MKRITLVLLLILTFEIQGQTQDSDSKMIEISGKVTDFDGNPIDSAMIQLKHPDFSNAYSTFSDSKRNYKLTGVKKGAYMSMYVLRSNEYPRRNAVTPEDMRLEFWAWNVIADRDLIINPRYGRLELYGLNAFTVFGGNSGIWLYVRPMSLGKLLQYDKDVYTDKSKIDEFVDINVYPEYFKAEVFVDDEPTKIKSMQKVEELAGTDKRVSTIGYLINIDYTITKRLERPLMIRVVGENTELNEKGENIYFLKFEDYQ